MNDLEKVTKIVLTGGACGGKTKALDILKERLDMQGYNTVIIPEAATTLLSKGYSPNIIGRKKFQEMILKLQIENEELILSYMQKCALPGVLLCDRGAIDGSAYMSKDMFTSITEMVGVNIEELYRRYDAVIHMQSLAVDMPEKYSLDNNEERLEEAEESKRIDNSLLRVWQPHPCVKVIDNSTDFEGKVKRVEKEILELLERSRGDKTNSDTTEEKIR